MKPISSIIQKIKPKASSKEIIRITALNLIFNIFFIRIIYAIALYYLVIFLQEEKIDIGEFIMYDHAVYAYYLLGTLIFFFFVTISIRDKVVLYFLNIVFIRQTHLNIVFTDFIKWKIGNWYLTGLVVLLLILMMFVLRSDLLKNSGEYNQAILDRDFEEISVDEK